MASRNAESLSHSIWALLPSFCNYPTDTAKSFRLVAKSLGDVLTNEPELRGIICFSLQVSVVVVAPLFVTLTFCTAVTSSPFLLCFLSTSAFV